VVEVSSDPKLVPYILPLVEGSTVLDVGCGRGKWGYLLKVDYWYTKAGRGKDELNYVVGTDLYSKYLRFVKYHRVYDDLVARAIILTVKNEEGTINSAIESTLGIDYPDHEVIIVYPDSKLL